MIYTRTYASPIGELTLASDGAALTGLWIEGQKYFPHFADGESQASESIPVLTEAARWLDEYFDGLRPDPSFLPLSPQGSDFRQRVWRLLLTIPYGSTVTYGELAREVFGKKSASAQAIGGAVGHNPISIIIPCHRVVGSGGSLTGYAGGLERKLWLLRHEGAEAAREKKPEKP